MFFKKAILIQRIFVLTDGINIVYLLLLFTDARIKNKETETETEGKTLQS